MKILSYEIKGDMIKVVTDNPNRPDFVYFKDKFDTIEKLQLEIERSIAREERKNNTKNSKVSNLLSELDAHIEVK